MTLLATCHTKAASWHYMNKNYVTHCFNLIDLLNTMVLLTMALASHDADASTNSVK